MVKGKTKPKKKIIKLDKNITASGARDFKDRLLNLVKDGIEDLTLDLKQVEMVDSVGLGVIIAAHNSLHSLGGTLTLKNVSNDIYRLFKTMRLDQHFEVIKAA
jgi:anti-anti-sigma factor